MSNVNSTPYLEPLNTRISRSSHAAEHYMTLNLQQARLTSETSRDERKGTKHNTLYTHLFT
jgi:hypothetical protein